MRARLRELARYAKLYHEELRRLAFEPSAEDAAAELEALAADLPRVAVRALRDGGRSPRPEIGAIIPSPHAPPRPGCALAPGPGARDAASRGARLQFRIRLLRPNTCVLRFDPGRARGAAGAEAALRRAAEGAAEGAGREGAGREASPRGWVRRVFGWAGRTAAQGGKAARVLAALFDSGADEAEEDADGAAAAGAATVAAEIGRMSLEILDARRRKSPPAPAPPRPALPRPAPRAGLAAPLWQARASSLRTKVSARGGCAAPTELASRIPRCASSASSDARARLAR